MVDAVHDRIQRDARFAADVSHELRTPVTTLTTSLSLLECAPDLSAGRQRAVELMADELTRFRGPWRTSWSSDAWTPTSTSQSSTTIDTRRARAATRWSAAVVTRLSWSMRPGSTKPWPITGDGVAVDLPQMVRALTNLFDNADIHGGGLPPRSASTAVTSSSTCTWRTRDPALIRRTGSASSSAFRGRARRKEGTGSGLGLSIVAQTVRNHGGSVWCGEAPDGGADLVLRLPLVSRGES